MTQEELVKQKADSLGQMCFPDANNVWARPNYEAQWVSEACMKMAEWERKRLVDMACEWLENNFVCFLQGAKRGIYSNQFATVEDMVDNFKRAMEE